jgi:hypothetical protein
MHEFEDFGRQMRAFLMGLLQGGAAVAPAERPASATDRWGPRIDLAGLDDVYHGAKVKPFTIPPAGIDNLALSSNDLFEIPGRGEFQVDFDGYFRVARDHPVSHDWADSSVFVNLVDMRLSGTHTDLGKISVSLNPSVVSAGQTFAPGVKSQPAACRIAAAARFTLEDQGITVFNKEPVLLMNEAINSIPPVEDPNGEARIYRLPLYSEADPDGQPVAYLKRLRYTVGNYITQKQAEEYRAA